MQVALNGAFETLILTKFMHLASQPREYDAILGSHASAPSVGVVLGGIEGVKKRLASASVEQQIAALSEALKYGETGLYLVVQAFLWNESDEVKTTAYLLLQEQEDPKVKQVLQEHLEKIRWETSKILKLYQAGTRHFPKVYLSGADLSEADLKEIFLIQANLSHAQLECANLEGANLMGANLTATNLFNANLIGRNIAKLQRGAI